MRSVIQQNAIFAHLHDNPAKNCHFCNCIWSATATQKQSGRGGGASDSATPQACSAHVIADLEPTQAKIEAAEKAIPPLQFGGAYLAFCEVTLILIAGQLLIANALIRIEGTARHGSYVAAKGISRH